MRRLLIVLACLAATGCAAGPSTTRPDESARAPAEIVGEVLRLSGTREATQSFEGALRRVVTALAGGETFRDPHVVTPIVESTITANRIFDGLAAHLEERFDRDRFDRVVVALRQPLAQRMTALEVASATVSPEAIAAWKSRYAVTASGRERYALARRLDAATGATEATMGILYAAGRGAFRAVAGRADAPAPDALRAAMAKLEPETREETIDALAYAYREARIVEIEQYAESLETELGRWFSRLLSDAAARVAESLSETTIRRVMEARRAPRV